MLGSLGNHRYTRRIWRAFAALLIWGASNAISSSFFKGFWSFLSHSGDRGSSQCSNNVTSRLVLWYSRSFNLEPRPLPVSGAIFNKFAPLKTEFIVTFDSKVHSSPYCARPWVCLSVGHPKTLEPRRLVRAVAKLSYLLSEMNMKEYLQEET